jgi:small subunit ribosomal protein S16
MVRIRLRRVGGRSQASFRIIATDKESPNNGRFIEILGFYNPRTQPATIQLKEDRIYEWISKGAQPSDSASQVFKVAGLIDRYERFKKGEKVETLLAEAESAASTRNANRQTRREAPQAGTSAKKKKAAAAKPAEAAASEATPAEAAAPEEPAPAAEVEAPKTEEAPSE